MIIMFPVLVSQAVSENAIPGIAKTLESFLIVNSMNEIMSDPQMADFMKSTSNTGNFDFKIKGGKFTIKEGILDLTAPGNKQQEPDNEKERKGTEKEEREEREEARRKAEHKLKQKKAALDILKKKMEIEKSKKDEEKEKKEKDTKKASVKLTVGDNKAINLEPSYVVTEVTDKWGNIRREMIGIKVIPFRVKSEVRLSRLILNDIKIGLIDSIFIGMGRSIIKSAYRFIDKWTFRIIKRTPTGDPRQDILFGRSGFTGKGAIILSKNEDIDEDFINDINKMNKLFRLGWGNIIIADDINRQAAFCMKQFKGICNIVSYASMYQNIGQLKVYETLEDAKKQSSSLFKMKKGFTKIIGEIKSQDLFDKYNIIKEDNNNGNS